MIAPTLAGCIANHEEAFEFTHGCVDWFERFYQKLAPASRGTDIEGIPKSICCSQLES